MSDKKMRSSFIAKNISIPKPTEKDNKKDLIVNWGIDNYYPYFLNFLYQNSAIHSGVVNAKVHYTTSGGLNYLGPDSEEFKRFFENGNSDYNLDEIAEQMSKDLELSNMFCLRGVWSLDKSRVDKLEVVDFEKVRYRLDDDKIAVSQDWSDLKDNTIKLISPFDASNRDEREFYLIYQEKGKQTIEGRTVNKSLYPQPPYSGGLTSILTDVKINKYQLSEITNNFSTGTIINLNSGQPADEKEKRDLERDIQENSTGENNAGGVLVLYNLGKENEASVVNLSGNDLKDRYIALSQDNRNNILLAHSVTTPILFGIKTEGSLGNATELEIGYKIMKSNYFKYKQRAILSALNYIAKKGNRLQGKIDFNEVSLDFIPKIEDPVIEEFQKKKIESYNDGETLDVVEELNKCGIPKPERIIYSRALPNEFNVDEQEAELLEEFKKETFAKLSAVENQVLSMISDGEEYENIRKSLDIDAIKLAKTYKRLDALGLINKKNITSLGIREIARQDVTRIKIYYAYEKNPAISGPPILPNNRTRNFCKDLVTLSKRKVWSREDIDTIGRAVGRNIFTYRGGFFNNGKKVTPWCRHVWSQKIVYI